MDTAPRTVTPTPAATKTETLPSGVSADLEALSMKELEDRKERIKAMIKAKQKEKRVDFFDHLEALMGDAGITLKEVGAYANPPKFVHPDKPELFWSGTGKPKKWILEEEKDGRNREDFLNPRWKEVNKNGAS